VSNPATDCLRISIILPVLNESVLIESALRSLEPLRMRGHEVIVVDGGSSDATGEIAERIADRLVRTNCGRAEQMNAGAAIARGDVLLFLHVDTKLPTDADTSILTACGKAYLWGRFDVRLSGSNWLFRIIESMMNWRSRLTGIATGDQGIFVQAVLFRRVGGWPQIPLMEDIALSRILRRESAPACLAQRVESASRRWEENGIIKTIFTMWTLRLAFFLGADPRRLARYYGYG
jgi:rSAM/selenodomain-associated transferase 2